jgi:tripartite-type tricarboxylate transporter receptor subunit TctC
MLLGAAAMATQLAAPAFATTFPRGPITLVVPFPTGGTVDAMARELALSMTSALGQPVVVDNRPGAAALVATQQVARAAPDGQTLLLVTTAYSINALARPKPGYDPFRSFVPVAHLVNGSAVWVASAEAPAKDARELLQRYRSRPGELSVGTWGPASSTDIYAAMIAHATGVDLMRVPYKGEAPALVDTLGGTLTSSFITVGSLQAHAGKLKPLAITGPARNALLPSLPTFSEIGVPGPDVSGYVGIVAPAGVPDDIVDRLSAVLLAGLRQSTLARKIESDWGFQMVAAGSRDFASTLRSDMPRWESAIRAFNITA